MEEMRDTNALASAAVPKRNMIPKPITNRPQPRTINFCANPAAVRDTIVISIPEITHANPDTPKAKMMEPMVTTPAKMKIMLPSLQILISVRRCPSAWTARTYPRSFPTVS